MLMIYMTHLVYLLFIKLPLAASKFLVYTLLRVAISKEKKKINKISLRSFLFNMVFINLSNISDEVITKLQNYIKYVHLQENQINQTEQEKNKLKDMYFK